MVCSGSGAASALWHQAFSHVLGPDTHAGPTGETASQLWHSSASASGSRGPRPKNSVAAATSFAEKPQVHPSAGHQSRPLSIQLPGGQSIDLPANLMGPSSPDKSLSQGSGLGSTGLGSTGFNSMGMMPGNMTGAAGNPAYGLAGTGIVAPGADALGLGANPYMGSLGSLMDSFTAPGGPGMLEPPGMIRMMRAGGLPAQMPLGAGMPAIGAQGIGGLGASGFTDAHPIDIPGNPYSSTSFLALSTPLPLPPAEWSAFF